MNCVNDVWRKTICTSKLKTYNVYCLLILINFTVNYVYILRMYDFFLQPNRTCVFAKQRNFSFSALFVIIFLLQIILEKFWYFRDWRVNPTFNLHVLFQEKKRLLSLELEGHYHINWASALKLYTLTPIPLPLIKTAHQACMYYFVCMYSFVWFIETGVFQWLLH